MSPNLVRCRSNLVRTRTTVKAQPGLFLQPHIVNQLVGRLIQEIVEGSEVTPAEFGVASWLNAVGSATPSGLAEQLGMSATTLSAIIERLVRKGQVRRVAHPEDGRSYLLELTERGRATNARNGGRFRARMESVRAYLGTDPEEVLVPLRRLEAALRRTLEEPAR